MLYPLKFNPIFKEKIWGGQKLNSFLNKNIPSNKPIGESWEISAVQDNISVVSNGYLAGNNLQELVEIYMSDLVGDKIYHQFGIEFPLLIKFIDASDILSVQVHPNDEIAKERHNAYGKNEIWYIIDAEKNAELILGFKDTIAKEEYIKHLNNKTLNNILNSVKVNKDEVYYIPAGKVHAIGKGILLAEIQQTSDITYRIYDWDRTDVNGKSRELHTDLALDVIDFQKTEKLKSEYQTKENDAVEIEKTPYFTLNKIKLNQKLERDYSKLDSFVIYMILDGEISLQDENNNKETAQKGETILIPAELKHIRIVPKPNAEILEIYI